MSAPWIAALTSVAEQLNGIHVQWMLVGSAATALHGVAIVPGDLDIAVLEAADVARAATVLPTPDGPLAERSGDPVDWVSTVAEPTLQFDHAGEQWTFGTWMIRGVKVELAHIHAPAAAALMMETRAPLVWRERVILSCLGQPVPTVPVEVQLATMIARQQDARIQATVAAIDSTSVNLALLRRAIADRRSEVPALTVPESVQRLLMGGRTATGASEPAEEGF
jgi:hypothetical protein